MDGVHDMGGMDGFGKVEPEPNEPVFHHRWEGRVLAMSRAIGVFRAWTIDTSRHAIELMAPSIYLTRPYYEKWFLRNQQLLIERGLIDSDEVAAGRALRPAKSMKRGPFTLADVEKVTRRGSYGRPAPAPAQFKVGDRVRTKNIHPTTHTRLPRYARGHVVWSSACMALTSFPTRRLPAKGTIRSGFIPCASMLRSYGVRTPTQS